MFKMKNIRRRVSKKSPTLLLIVGIGSMLGAVYSACKDTEKYIDMRKALPDPPTKKETLKMVGKCYWKTAIFTGISITSFVSGNRILTNRNTALAAMYAASEAKYLEYAKKTKDLVGEKKEQEIRERLAEDRLKYDKPPKEALDHIPIGETLCYDNMFGRYFFSSTEKIQAAEKKLNDRLYSQMYISLNEFYQELGLSPIHFGDEFGWNIDNGLIDISRTYADTSDGTTCIVIDYDITPRCGFDKLL